ncbi:WD40 repeat-like protein [Mycena venus]|uniref:WD40 repeat-like protein n=1 Tax=Mycena venus TaxID=2733690 RepID=A0A8H7D6C3_9AGAR|nr:WD40 repeat-like protein [Mycena venus]
MPQTYSLHVHSVSGIKWRKKWPIPPNLNVTIDVDDIRMAETHRKRDFVPMWNSLLPLSAARPTSVIGLHLVRHHTVGKTNICAKGEIEIYVPIPLKFVGKDLEPTPGLALVIRLARIGTDEAVKIAVTDAAEDSEKLGSVTSDIDKVADFAVQNSDSNIVSSLGDLLQSLTSSLDVVLKIGGVIAKIHPFAELAYNVLTSVYQAVKQQRKTDQSIVQLVQAMVDVYSFTKDVKSLSEIARIKEIVGAIVLETAKCALFIREYTGHGFAVRMVSQIISEDAQTIQEFMDAFDKHKQSLDWALGLHVAVVVNDTRRTAQLSLKVAKETRDTAQRLEQMAMLEKLNPVKMNSDRDGCLPGTRRDILSLIIAELTKPFSVDSQNLFWLYGVAGAGKSTIAMSIHQIFDSLGLLGASLFFTRGNDTSSPSSVIRTIAYLLAESNTDIASEICYAIRQHRHIGNASIEEQFQRLLVEPLDRAKKHIHAPILIILDALDECGDLESRHRLVSLISNRFANLPVLCIFITSRPDLDIAAAFRDHSSIVKTPLDITKPSSLEDIRLYLNAEMVNVRQRHFSWNLGPTWPGDSKIAALTACAAGLFIWASTATKYLRNTSNDPNDDLDYLLDKGLDLDGMYKIALQSTKLWEGRTFAGRTRACLAAVVLGKVPMSDTTINVLLGLDAKDSSAHVFFKLGCVLQWAPGEFARLLHASFGDYLTDPERCGQEPWFINPALWGLQLAHSCLRVLKTELCFNICRLEDSHISNTAVHNLADRITTYIPAHLSYSSCFWADHILGAEWDEAILTDIENLMYNKFPFWLEILSILGEIGIGINALRHVGEVSKQRNIALAEFLADAVKFMVTFAPAVSHSVPHLYLSALPLAPSKSCIAEKFSVWLVQKVEVDSSLGLGDHWPALQTTIKAHDNIVTTVAFSPGNGEWLASGSWDTTVRVWDTRTGALIAAPFEGHTKLVRCVAFSPDGERIASGSHDTTVRIWDSRTGVLVAGPIQHSGNVNSVAFSPDGECIVSGGGDSNIYVWNSRTGTQIEVLKGHSSYVMSVAFSQDGDQIVSGSADRTLCVWNVHLEVGVVGRMEGYTPRIQSVGAGTQILSPSGRITGVLPPFEGHTNTVRCVAFSADGERIVSGSPDKTVRVWDSRTGALLVGPIQHDDKLMSVAFSPDGERIVSGGNDIMVWNSQTGTLMAGPFRGHGAPLNSVAFSPDGERIVSGSADNTICIWDAQALGMEKVKSEGHSDIVWSVTFSPDGEQIVSGSEDGVCVWNSQNGNLVTGPIQTSPAYCVAFSPDGAHIASGSADSTISIWGAQTGDLVTRLEDHTEAILSIAFSPDGNQIASGSGDKTVRVWDVKKGILTASPFEGHSMLVYCVAFSPDGERIASGSYDTTVRVWDSRTGAVIAGPFHHHDWVTGVAFSPDGERIVSGCKDGNVCVWNSRTGAILLTLPECRMTICCVAFSPDGETIASGLEDGTVRMWPAEISIQGHGGGVHSVAFSSDGNRLVSSSADRTIRIHELNRAPDRPFEHGSSFSDGWILNAKSELMLWIPLWLRDVLYHPQTSLVISATGTTKLDFSRFVHGTSWEECMDPRFRTK